jgi:hypothetical protein
VVIDEPEDGLETTAIKFDVSGHCSSGILVEDEINVIELSLNNELIEYRNNYTCGSFLFSNVTLPNGDIQITVTGSYTDNPALEGFDDYVASDTVSIFCDNIPPTLIINTPRRNKIVYSSSVTFIGSISDNDEVKSFTYVGKHGHNGNITINNGNWNVTIDNLPYEYQNVTFRAEDRLGNIKTKTVYFTCSE